jgi:metacaspase-1
MIPAALAVQLFSEQVKLQRQPKPGPIQCGLVLISSCQDNQTSSDGPVNGLFTETLLKVWDDGNFQGTIPQFHRAIAALTPADQTPNYDPVGLDHDVISNGRPLTILGGSAASADTHHRNTKLGDKNRRITKLQSDLRVRPQWRCLATNLASFDDSNLRTSQNFYATWSDSPRLQDGTWSVPDEVWTHMKGGSALYYRAGSTTSTNGWDDYLVSSAGNLTSLPR